MTRIELETERLILRDFKATDWKAVHEYAVDPEVCKFMLWGPNTVEETHHYIDTALAQQRVNPRQSFELAVILKSESKLIGGAGIRLIPGETQTADMGYCFNRKYWKQGFAKEASLRLIRFGFQDFALHRIFATCDADNIGSASVLRGCGMRQEAHFVKDKFIKNAWRDTFLFAILKEEWELRS